MCSLTVDYKDLVMTQKQQLDDIEDVNFGLKRELDSKTMQLEKLSFINKDFKEKANIGMLEFLELELKNKEQQLAGMHARLDEKQKEYVSKLENYQQIFNENRNKIRELEDENFTLTQRVSDLEKQNVLGGTASQDIVEKIQELHTIEGELRAEREKTRKVHEDIYREKDRVMHLEIKLSDQERKNVDLNLRIGDLEAKVDEYEGHLKKLEVYSE